MRRLVAHRWPGNVRELEHAVQFAYVLAERGRIDTEDLPPTVLAEPGASTAPPTTRPTRARRRSASKPTRAELVTALEAHDGHRESTADSLGVSRMTLWKWMRDLDVEWP